MPTFYSQQRSLQTNCPASNCAKWLILVHIQVVCFFYSIILKTLQFLQLALVQCDIGMMYPLSANLRFKYQPRLLKNPHRSATALKMQKGNPRFGFTSSVAPTHHTERNRKRRLCCHSIRVFWPLPAVLFPGLHLDASLLPSIS